MKVFVVITESVWDVTNNELKVDVFKTKEDALKKVAFIKEDEVEAYRYIFDEEEIEVEDHNDGGFEIYQDGYWCENHTICKIFEREM